MTRDEIMALAEKVGLTGLSLIDVAYLESFAELVAAVEREACACVCESLFDLTDDTCDEAEQCAAAIRTRAQA